MLFLGKYIFVVDNYLYQFTHYCLWNCLLGLIFPLSSKLRRDMSFKFFGKELRDSIWKSGTIPLQMDEHNNTEEKNQTKHPKNKKHTRDEREVDQHESSVLYSKKSSSSIILLPLLLLQLIFSFIVFVILRTQCSKFIFLLPFKFQLRQSQIQFKRGYSQNNYNKLHNKLLLCLKTKHESIFHKHTIYRSVEISNGINVATTSF